MQWATKKPSVYKDRKDDPVYSETVKSGRSWRSDGWSDDDESDFLDSGDNFSKDEGDDTRCVNLHENPDCKWSAHDAPVCDGRDKSPTEGEKAQKLKFHSFG